MLAWVDMGACTARGSKGVWIFVTKSELQMRFDPAAQYGKTSSGLSTLAVSTFGYVSIPGTNPRVSTVASRRIANAARKRVRRSKAREVNSQGPATPAKRRRPHVAGTGCTPPTLTLI